jgi:hypothetical protein
MLQNVPVGQCRNDNQNKKFFDIKTSSKNRKYIIRCKSACEPGVSWPLVYRVDSLLSPTPKGR